MCVCVSLFVSVSACLRLSMLLCLCVSGCVYVCRSVSLCVCMRLRVPTSGCLFVSICSHPLSLSLYLSLFISIHNEHRPHHGGNRSSARRISWKILGTMPAHTCEIPSSRQPAMLHASHLGPRLPVVSAVARKWEIPNHLASECRMKSKTSASKLV